MEEIRYKRGDLNITTGKVFWAYHNDYKNNQMWVTKEKYLELQETRLEKSRRPCEKKKNIERYYRNKQKRDLYANNYNNSIDALKRIYLNSKGSSKNRKLEFTITLDYIYNLWDKQEGKCYYTNLSMLREHLSNSPYQVSIDRIDSSKGYIIDNIVLCCISMNFAKNKYKVEDFINFINNIKNN